MDFIGILIGITGTVIAAWRVYYGREQAKAAKEPVEPELSLGEIRWVRQDWLRVTVLSNNPTSAHWTMTSAHLTLPSGGKLISEHQIPRSGTSDDLQITDLEYVDLQVITNFAQPLSKLAPVGTRSELNFYGMNDGCREDFFAFIPASSSAEEISIIFTLEDNSFNARQSRTTLNRRLPHRSVSPTV